MVTTTPPEGTASITTLTQPTNPTTTAIPTTTTSTTTTTTTPTTTINVKPSSSTSIKFDTTTNVTTTEVMTPGGGSKTGLIAGVVVGLLVLVIIAVVIVIVFFIWRKYKKEKEEEENKPAPHVPSWLTLREKETPNRPEISDATFTDPDPYANHAVVDRQRKISEGSRPICHPPPAPAVFVLDETEAHSDPILIATTPVLKRDEASYANLKELAKRGKQTQNTDQNETSVQKPGVPYLRKPSFDLLPDISQFSNTIQQMKTQVKNSLVEEDEDSYRNSANGLRLPEDASINSNENPYVHASSVTRTVETSSSPARDSAQNENLGLIHNPVYEKPSMDDQNVPPPHAHNQKPKKGYVNVPSTQTDYTNFSEKRNS